MASRPGASPCVARRRRPDSEALRLYAGQRLVSPPTRGVVTRWRSTRQPISQLLSGDYMNVPLGETSPASVPSSPGQRPGHVRRRPVREAFPSPVTDVRQAPPPSSAAIRNPTGWSTAPCCPGRAARQHARTGASAAASAGGAGRRDILAIRDMERADIITSRADPPQLFQLFRGCALDGVDADHPAVIVNKAPRAARESGRSGGAASRSGGPESSCVRTRIAGSRSAARPVHHGAAGQDEHYGDRWRWVSPIRGQIRSGPRAAGADLVQIDEPWRATTQSASVSRYAPSTPRSRASPVPTVNCTCTSVTRRWCRARSRPATRSWSSWRTAASTRSPSKIPRSQARPRHAEDLANRRSCSASSTSAARPSTHAGGGRPRASVPGLQFIAPGNLVPTPDCGMKLLPPPPSASSRRSPTVPPLSAAR